MRRLVVAAVVLAFAGAAGAGIYDRMEDQARLKNRAAFLAGGDPDRGRSALKLRTCGGCHEIPGVPGAKGAVGPSLARFAGRGIIAGRLPNTPDNLKTWIFHPHAIDPQTAMPETGVTPQEAADIAAYLYTLQ
jgi:cytochrome c2